MARVSTPTFVSTFEIVSQAALKNAGKFSDLDKMSEFYRRSYNSCLGRFYRLALQMKRSPEWELARRMPRKTKKDKSLRSKTFNNILSPVPPNIE